MKECWFASLLHVNRSFAKIVVLVLVHLSQISMERKFTDQQGISLYVNKFQGISGAKE